MNSKFDDFIYQLQNSDEWLELNKQRKLTYWRYALSWCIGIGLLLLGFGLLIFGSDSETIESGLGSLVMSVVIIIILVRMSHKLYSGQYKQIVVPKLLADVLEQFDNKTDPVSGKRNKFKYYRGKHIGFSHVTEFPLFEKYNHDKISYQGEDLFKGTLGATEFQFSDFVMKRSRDTIIGINRTDHSSQTIDFTVFRGLVFIADFHKSFNGTTTITTRTGKQYKYQKAVGARINTISHEFDQMFKVHTTDDTTAQYLLPVNMLERIDAMRKLFPNKGLAICLHNGKVAISIHNFDFFEISKARKPGNKDIQRTYTEISAILEIIELLNLNLRIWSKE